MHKRTLSKLAVAAVAAVTAVALLGLGPVSAGATTRSQTNADITLDALMRRLVATRGGPPGAAVVVDRGGNPTLHTAGVANIETGQPPHIDDHMRLASVAKAFSGAAALSVVASGRLPLNSTVGQIRPDLPRAWWPATLAQLLNHTSGVPDFSDSTAFRAALVASLLNPPPPRELLSFVEDEPLEFPPGSRYQYSNSDNVIIGLMIESATGEPYEQVLQERVYGPLGLNETSLPRDEVMPEPFIHGYDLGPPLTDVSEQFAAGWTWASGGIVSTPADTDRFIRGYAAGGTTTAAVHAAQSQFIPGGDSKPPGPGRNSAGLGIFRYDTPCGTVYGHTGNTAGYTQFIASTADGTRSATVSINAQITPKTSARNFALLRLVFQAAVCAATA